MLRYLYTGAGVVMICVYLLWSWMGWELGSSTRDPVPTYRPYSSSSGGGYYGRSSGGYSRSGFGWGK